MSVIELGQKLAGLNDRIAAMRGNNRRLCEWLMAQCETEIAAVGKRMADIVDHFNEQDRIAASVLGEETIEQPEIPDENVENQSVEPEPAVDSDPVPVDVGRARRSRAKRAA